MNEKFPIVNDPKCNRRADNSARQLQKLAKNDNPVSLAIIKQTNESSQRRGNKAINYLRTVWQILQ